ncbi:GNAT family N-acetyltransferase [Trinickia fusca]|uniref:N-acetyltransferase family protein n=1 Tax=Trinickia fusca TaxID=2419777 RepID=A0A494XBL2_9BURK|nr:GNAT family N-acetyltransferase [Trinickia fusca]RKP48217.1 N-acetyltransferase family protein [Trinickia fusca]
MESTVDSKIWVRDAETADITAVQGIYAHYVLNGIASFEETPPSRDDMAGRRDAVLTAGLPYLVAEVEGKVVGYAYATPYRPRSAYRFTIEDSVYVENGLGRRGIGRALLSELTLRCEQGPWRQMLAVVGDSGNAGSIALHESLGFRKIGVLAAVGFKRGQWVDTVLMQRPLGSGATNPPLPAGTRDDRA